MKKIMSALTGLGLLALAPGANAVVIMDSTFANVDWTKTTLSISNATETATQSAAGGNPGSFRTMSHNFGSGIASLFIFHEYIGTGGTYDPGTSGAIASIDYSEDQKKLAGTGAVGAFVAIKQGGVIFKGPVLNFSNDTTWITASSMGLTATDFLDFTTSTFNPDFSAAGATISFGYGRANDTNRISPTTITHGIDNWTFTINQITIPEPGTLALFCFGLAGLGFARHRKAAA
jgi:hypothetical protein